MVCGKHLADACDAIHLLDLGGNVRKGHPGDANVFDIQVGVSINLFVKKGQAGEGPARIFCNGETAELNKEATLNFWRHANTSEMSIGKRLNLMHDRRGSPKGCAKILRPLCQSGVKPQKQRKIRYQV